MHFYVSRKKKKTCRGGRGSVKTLLQPVRATSNHATVADLGALGSVHILCAYINNVADVQKGSLKNEQIKNMLFHIPPPCSKI